MGWPRGAGGGQEPNTVLGAQAAPHPTACWELWSPPVSPMSLTWHGVPPPPCHPTTPVSPRCHPAFHAVTPHVTLLTLVAPVSPARHPLDGVG